MPGHDASSVVTTYVRAWSDLITNTPAGTIPTAGWFQLRDGKIAAIRVFFDARPLDPAR